MRHVIVPNYTVDHPYQGSVWGCWPYHTYNFSSPTKDRVYVKVLKFVESHPKCHRKDIQRGVWGKSKPGLCSTLFAQMLYHDILDYNSKFEYKVTRKGKGILKKAAKAK